MAERGFHVIDPHTGRPATSLASVTVVGPDLTVADSYATAAMAMGTDAQDWIASLPGYEAYLIDVGSHVWWSAGFPGYAPALSASPQPWLAH
jgi:thiamine biosynthesis lipoprotein